MCRNPLDLVKDLYFMNLPLISIITVFTVGIFATHQFALAENTWYLGEGLKDGDYFRYYLCQADYKSCLPFEMGFWVKEKTDHGDWNMEVLVKDGKKIVKGYMQVGRISPEPIAYSDNIGPYASAYKKSIVWLSGFTAVLDQKASSEPNWNTMGTVKDFSVKIKILKETIAVPAGNFEAYVIGWHHGMDNKVWIVDNFPFPVKALTFVDVNNRVVPIQYQFELLEYGNSSTNPKFLDYDLAHVVISPAKQIANGVLREDVNCNEGLQLIFKSKDNSPACVKPQTAEKLVQCGWGSITISILQQVNSAKNSSNQDLKMGVYGISDQNQWNIVATSLDGTFKKNITSFDIENLQNMRPRWALDLKVSPDGKYLLYSFLNKQERELWLEETKTHNKNVIAKSNANQTLKDSYWSPNSKMVLFQIYEIPPPCDICGMSAFNPGGPWFIYDIDSKQTREIKAKDHRFPRSIGWLDDNYFLLLNTNNFGRPPIIYSYNINSKIAEPLYWLNAREQIDEIVVNKEGTILLPFASFAGTDCKLIVIDNGVKYEINLSDKNEGCYSNYNQNYWFSNDGKKLILGKTVNLNNNNMTNGLDDKYGRYLISSIYSLDLITGEEKPILLGSPDNSSFIMGGWDESNDALIYLEQSPIDDTELGFKLVMSRSDGSLPIEIARSQNEIPFYGWIPDQLNSLR